MVTKRALSRFERYFSELCNTQNISQLERKEVSNFTFNRFVSHQDQKMGTQLVINTNTTSLVEFLSSSAMVSTIVIEERTTFNLDFYAHSNTLILLKCIIKKN